MPNAHYVTYRTARFQMGLGATSDADAIDLSTALPTLDMEMTNEAERGQVVRFNPDGSHEVIARFDEVGFDLAHELLVAAVDKLEWYYANSPKQLHGTVGLLASIEDWLKQHPTE